MSKHDFMAEYRERERRRRAELPGIKRQLLADLKKHGVVTVSIDYDGEGDSGQIESVVGYDPAGNQVSLSVPAEKTDKPATETLETRLEDYAWRILQLHFDGFENNDGAYGDITIDVAKGTVTLDHNARFTDTSNTTMEV